jgi:hypothetical protein
VTRSVIPRGLWSKHTIPELWYYCNSATAEPEHLALEHELRYYCMQFRPIHNSRITPPYPTGRKETPWTIEPQTPA